jgi:hypothetical protein
MSPSAFLSLLSLLLTLSALPAQVPISSDPFGFAGSSQHKHVVRSSSGSLWALTIQEDLAGNRPLVLYTSGDQGQTWSPTSVTINDATSGLSGTYRTDEAAMAIDSQDVLHIVWGNYYYPTYYAQYYRQANLTTGSLSALVNLTALTGATNTSRTTAMNVAVDQNDTVWIAGHGTTSWVTRLLMSSQPGATNLAFTDLGPISMSASAQSVRLAVDAMGRVHCSYYRNIGSGEYWHRIYDPALGGWQPSTSIGNTQPSNDYLGTLCADGLGNVHALIGVDLYTSGPVWDFRYRRWDAANGWSAPIPLFAATPAQFTGIANYIIFALACDEATGKVTGVYRDLANGGALRIAEKDLAATAFTNLPDLTPPSLGQHEYYAPAIRGALFPTTNNTGTDLDITWRQGAAPGPYQLIHRRVSSGGGTTLTLPAPAAIGTTVNLDLFSPTDPNQAYLCGFALGTLPGIDLGNGQVVPLNADPLLIFSLSLNNGVFFNTSGLLSAVGGATVTIVVPNLPTLVGATIYSAFVVADTGSPSGIGTISPALGFMIQ